MLLICLDIAGIVQCGLKVLIADNGGEDFVFGIAFKDAAEKSFKAAVIAIYQRRHVPPFRLHDQKVTTVEIVAAAGKIALRK